MKTKSIRERRSDEQPILPPGIAMFVGSSKHRGELWRGGRLIDRERRMQQVGFK